MNMKIASSVWHLFTKQCVVICNICTCVPQMSVQEQKCTQHVYVVCTQHVQLHISTDTRMYTTCTCT